MEARNFENMSIENCEDVLKKMSNCTPLLYKGFRGHFQEGDLIYFEGATLVKEHTENCDFFTVRATFERNGSRRGVFIPLSFFTHCFFYRGKGADLMTTFPELFTMLSFLSTKRVVFGVKGVEERIFTKDERTRKYYNYYLDIFRMNREGE